MKKILSSVTGLFLALIFAVFPMKEDALLLSVRSPVTSSSTEIVLVYENKTGRPVTLCKDDYFAERKTENGWVAEPRLNQSAVKEVMDELWPQSGYRYTIKLSEPLETGEYRISHVYSVRTFSLKPPFALTGTAQTAVTEFTVA